jgi:hypothetical protein
LVFGGSPAQRTTVDKIETLMHRKEKEQLFFSGKVDSALILTALG